MPTLQSPTEQWTPVTAADEVLIRQELASIVASTEFRSSKRYPALLTYLVETRLGGRSAEIKERSIGCAVFERAADYDTTTDPVVRYNAGQVRRRLGSYYHAEGAGAQIQIQLPSGSYVPEFRRRSEGTSPKTPPPLEQVQLPEPPSFSGAEPVEALPPAPAPRRRYWGFAALAIAALLVAAFFLARRPDRLNTLWRPFLTGRQLLIVTENSLIPGLPAPGRPLISFETGISFSRVTGLCQAHGKPYKIQLAPTVTLDDMRDTPVVLLADSSWSQRMLSQLRYQVVKPTESTSRILDRNDPGAKRWAVDFAKTPQTSTFTDYAVVARFNDATTGAPVLALVGLGRDGTDAAAEFATSNHYLDLSADSLKRSDLQNQFELVLRTEVIDGKRGSPIVEAVYTW